MRVLFCSVEVGPFAKVGGLADVAGSLPKALSALKCDATVVMPAYGYLLKTLAAKEVLEFDFRVNPHWTAKGKAFEAEHDGLRLLLLDGDGMFAGIEGSQEIYSPGRDAYLFFSHAALKAAEALDLRPDVVHAHDWHTGLIPALMREAYAEAWDGVGAVFTIHNLGYQGAFGHDTLAAAGLPDSLYNMHQLETFGTVNFLKAGCVYADHVNTVSPTYALEITTEEYGCGLHGLMAHLAKQGRLHGILNGIDTDLFNPETDPALPAKYSVADLRGKETCRAVLRSELKLSITHDRPMLAVVSRLSEQKGLDLLIESAEDLLLFDACLVVLGLGDPGLAAQLESLQDRHPGRVRYVPAFEPNLAQRIYAGADIFLMPSAYEPCGLGQMIAMRYGTVPVVRRTGGLADTVFEQRNGYVFQRRDATDFVAAVGRAVRAFEEPGTWQQIILTAMEHKVDWARSAKDYLRLYNKAREARPSDSAAAAS